MAEEQQDGGGRIGSDNMKAATPANKWREKGGAVFMNYAGMGRGKWGRSGLFALFWRYL